MFVKSGFSEVSRIDRWQRLEQFIILKFLQIHYLFRNGLRKIKVNYGKVLYSLRRLLTGMVAM